ncbi:MAG: hypothetical protein WDO71_23965 [Bacteroidota bacterium]
MKKHFIKKYTVAASTERKFEIQYNLVKFNLAYKWQKYPAALQAFNFLKREKLVTLKMRLKLLFIQLPFFHKTLKSIKKTYIPKTSVSHL